MDITTAEATVKAIFFRAGTVENVQGEKVDEDPDRLTRRELEAITHFACTAAEKGRTLQSVEGLPFQERLLAFLWNVELSEEPAA